MPRLPPYHVPRHRLVDRLLGARIGVVEAAGGYGKSVLAEEFGAALGIATATAVLDAPETAPDALIERIRRAVRDAGLSDLAQVLGEGVDPAPVIDALIERLAIEPEPVLLVLDDVHLASPAAASTLVLLVRKIPAPHRLLLVGRRVPPAAEDLRHDPGAIVLSTADLAFRDDEVRELLTNFGMALQPHDAAAVARATSSWPAALVLSAARLARSDEPQVAIADLGAHSTLSELLGRDLDVLSPADRGALIEIAHLPMIDPVVLDSLVDPPGLFDRLVVAGLPLTPSPRGGWQLPGPIQEYVAHLGDLTTDTARRIAAIYRGQNRIEAALTTHLAAGDLHGAAALLGGLSPEEAHELDVVTLGGAVDVLTGDAIRHHPRLMVHLARSCEMAGQFRRRAESLGRARTLAAGDAILTREVDAELARDLIRDGRADEAERLAASVLATAGPDEIDNRALALDVLGRAKGRRRDAQSLAEAEALLEEAIGLFRSLGRRTWIAQILMPLAMHVHFAQGRYEQAVLRIDEGLAGLAGRNRLRAVILTFRAQVLHEAGRYAEAEASLREARALGELARDNRVLGYVAWEEAVGASQLGDAPRTVRLLREAESRTGDWFGHETGAEFLAAAVEALARVGETGRAHEYLQRAEARAAESPLVIRLARGAFEARTGDPIAAGVALAEVAAMARLEPREAWRVTLLSAYAALRRGDEQAGHLAAEAFDAAEAIGDPSLPLIRERVIAERLVGLAAQAGSSAASGVAMAALPAAINVLGGFEVLDGGRRLDIPRGKPETLVKLVAVSGGRIPVEEAIETIWPDEPPDAGRRGLRNVLLRLHASGRQLVERSGDVLVLATGTEVDATTFERDARRAIASRRPQEAAVLARTIVPRYRGDLLPDDLSEPWTTVPRERLRLRLLALLDLLIRDAIARRELDEALRLLDRAIEADAFDEGRYLEAAGLLMQQGRRLRAVAMLQRGRAVLFSLGVTPPPLFAQLERELSAAPS